MHCDRTFLGAQSLTGLVRLSCERIRARVGEVLEIRCVRNGCQAGDVDLAAELDLSGLPKNPHTGHT